MVPRGPVIVSSVGVGVRVTEGGYFIGFLPI